MAMRPASSSPLVRRTIDLNYENKLRASSLKWIFVNGFFCLLFTYDLSCKCPGYMTWLHYVELGAAVVLVLGLLHHARRLLPARRDVLNMTHKQQSLLGLRDSQLDSSFRLIEDSAISPSASLCASETDAGELLSLSRSWGSSSAEDKSRHSPPPQQRHSPPPRHSKSYTNEFIADRSSLADYLRQYEERSHSMLSSSLDSSMASPLGPLPSLGALSPLSPLSPLSSLSNLSPLGSSPVSAHTYKLATLDNESSSGETRQTSKGGGGAGAAEAWRLPLDPTRLTDFNLNLRLWLRETIFVRLERQLAVADEELARRGLPDKPLGQVGWSVVSEAARDCAAARGLLPYLRAAADQTYLVKRVRELARGPCLSQYKWDGGSADWDDTKPTDAEIVWECFIRYVDGQGGGCGGWCWAGGAGCARCRQFSAAHLAAPAPAPAHTTSPPTTTTTHSLALRKAATRPPHFQILSNGTVIDVGAGRNNLLHTLLVFIALAAGPAADSPLDLQSPPSPSPLAAPIRRLHLGRAGLNLLWVIGR